MKLDTWESMADSLLRHMLQHLALPFLLKGQLQRGKEKLKTIKDKITLIKEEIRGGPCLGDQCGESLAKRILGSLLCHASGDFNKDLNCLFS